MTIAHPAILTGLVLAATTLAHSWEWAPSEQDLQRYRHALNSGRTHGFRIVGIEPALQWRMEEHWVAAAGVLFTVAGRNAVDAIYPNFSLFRYWSRIDEVIMP